MRVALAAVVGMAVTSGCASVEARRYAQTRAVCGLEGTEPITAEAYHDEPTYPSEACVDAILDDLGADREALLAADDLADPYAGVRGEPSLDTVVGTLLGAARALLVTELGDAGGAIGEALADVRAVTGESDAAPLLYDYVVERVRETRPRGDGPGDAEMHPSSGRLDWDVRGAAAFDATALLVHEARHVDGFRHVNCDDGRRVCDDGADGAVGFQRGVYELLRDTTDDDLLVEMQDVRIDQLSERIVAR